MPFLGFRCSEANFADFSRALGHLTVPQPSSVCLPGCYPPTHRHSAADKVGPNLPWVRAFYAHSPQHPGGVSPRDLPTGAASLLLQHLQFLALLQYNLHTIESPVLSAQFMSLGNYTESHQDTTTVKTQNISLTLKKHPWPQLLLRT